MVIHQDYFHLCMQIKIKVQIKRVKKRNTEMKIIPQFLFNNNPIFDLNSTSFKMDKGKENSGRCVIFKELGINTSYFGNFIIWS